jgi:hypothetical protein
MPWAGFDSCTLTVDPTGSGQIRLYAFRERHSRAPPRNGRTIDTCGGSLRPVGAKALIRRVEVVRYR